MIGISGVVRRAQLGRILFPDWSQWRDAGSRIYKKVQWDMSGCPKAVLDKKGRRFN